MQLLFLLSVGFQSTTYPVASCNLSGKFSLKNKQKMCLPFISVLLSFKKKNKTHLFSTLIMNSYSVSPYTVVNSMWFWTYGLSLHSAVALISCLTLDSRVLSTCPACFRDEKGEWVSVMKKMFKEVWSFVTSYSWHSFFMSVYKLFMHPSIPPFSHFFL